MLRSNKIGLVIRAAYDDSDAFRASISSDLDDLAFAARLIVATQGLAEFDTLDGEEEYRIMPLGIYRRHEDDDVFVIYAIFSMAEAFARVMVDGRQGARHDRSEDDLRGPVKDLVMVQVTPSEIAHGVPPMMDRPLIYLCPDCLSSHRQED